MTWKKIVLAGTFAAAGFVSVHLPAQQSRGSANRSIVAPAHDRIKTVVDEAYARFRSDTTGKNADYIPYLAQVDSKLFGISRSSPPTTRAIRSATRAMLSPSSRSRRSSRLPCHGGDRRRESVRAHRIRADGQAVQLSGGGRGYAARNRKSSGECGGDRHHQPDLRTERRLRNGTRSWTFTAKRPGEKLSLIDEVYQSEAATNQGNRALAALLLKYERIYSDPLEAVDIYTKACSVGANVEAACPDGSDPGQQWASIR